MTQGNDSNRRKHRERPRAYADIVSDQYGAKSDSPIPTGRASQLIWEEFPELKKKYWGQHLLARGCFCATVGSVTKETIREYSRKQSEQGDVNHFKIEDEF